MTQFPFFLDYSKHFSLKDFTRAVISVSTTWTCSFSARTWFWIAYLIYSKPQEISQLKTLGLAKTSEKKKIEKKNIMLHSNYNKRTCKCNKTSFNSGEKKNTSISEAQKAQHLFSLKHKQSWLHENSLN